MYAIRVGVGFYIDKYMDYLVSIIFFAFFMVCIDGKERIWLHPLQGFVYLCAGIGGNELF